MSLHDTEVELPALTRLGTSYSSLTNVQPQFDSGVAQLISRPVSAAWFLFWTPLTSVLLAVFTSIWWPHAKDQMGALAVPIFVTVAVLAVFGPMMMAHIHNSGCSRVNPLIEIDLAQSVVRLRNRQKTFPLSGVHSLVAATVPNSEGGRLAELQLMIHGDNTVIAELVCTKYNSSSRRSFGDALSAISQNCPFPMFVVEPTGFFGRGPLAVTKV